MIKVFATREGLVGGKTASGYKVDAFVPFVALPAQAALRQWIRLYHPDTGEFTRALVLDVGPWNVADNAYVFQPATLGHPVIEEKDIIRPQSELGVDLFGRKTNKAGIDLGEFVWTALGMKDNGDVEWEFE